MRYDARLRRLDELLEEAGRYCHPDAPLEYVVVSRSRFQRGRYESKLLAELYDPSRAGDKVSVKLEVDGREVELVKDPVLDDRFQVVVRRSPRNARLTFREVASILSRIEELLGEEIDWGTPFPRGSC